jgi:hypothetical protein
LANANFNEQPATLGFTKGTYGDFNELWFELIGNALISTMTINAVFPLIEFAIFWAMRWFARYRDTGLLFVSCSKKYDVYKTKTHMIQ